MRQTYDHIIKTATTEYLPVDDWRLLKAQLFQESTLNPDAVSPVGAQGVAQFMPGTWGDVNKKLRLPAKATPFNPQYAIPAAAYYMRQLWEGWTAKRSDMDRYCLALASYNAGMGNIIKAQKNAGERIGHTVNDYASIITGLEAVTGKANAHETTTYVKKILGYYTDLIINSK